MTEDTHMLFIFDDDLEAILLYLNYDLSLIPPFQFPNICNPIEFIKLQAAGSVRLLLHVQ